ncbi:SDR family oxidoreductase [Kitasatospora phosalacinea]|uniref:NmrA family transcriptional regulator n=1 Tax=Kitasatospora phosalacinea TaxID=2065 RepID=A0A9W6PJX6_9ACTN|nr:NAD(P)H-binding protein [Kitasatospora phosalacinea]GLW56421.1 NmrA family transcriptional regulator [Kitasatospora phosalacinea]
MKILVTGGTGTLGRHVLPRLVGPGREVRVLTRRARPDTADVAYRVGDLVAGTGLDGALEGVDTVLHLAGGAKGDDTAARHLAAAMARAGGVRHVVMVSVIGAATMPLGWFRAKRDAELAVADSGVPWTVLRAAQFHDLVRDVAGKVGKLPVLPAPGGLRFEPVDARDVADRLVALTLAAPAGLVPDLAGPRDYAFADLVRSTLKRRRPTLPVPLAGKVGRAYRNGENLAGADAVRGTRTWEDFLAGR